MIVEKSDSSILFYDFLFLEIVYGFDRESYLGQPFFFVERISEIGLIRGGEINEPSFSLPVVVDMEAEALERLSMEYDPVRSFDDYPVIDVVSEVVFSF